MRYWILTTEYPPFYGGGISTYCRITATSLANSDFEVTVFVPDSSVKNYTISSSRDNLRVVRFNPDLSKRSDMLGYEANLSYSFAEVIKLFISLECSPDFIESQDYLGIAYYLQQFKLTGLLPLQTTPIIITLHSPAFVYLEYNRVPTYRFPEFWTCEMEKASINSADILISPTKFLKDKVEKYIDLSNQKTHILPNPFIIENEPTSSFVPNRIVYYGKLSAQKGSFKLLEYFDKMWCEGFVHPLYIIGGTDIVYYPEFKTMYQVISRRYGHYIENGLLNFIGKIKPSEITKMIQDAHVVVVPSIVDNLPYVVMECMARKKIVLASVQGGQKEIISDNENGFLFDHDEENSFASKLEYILSLNNEQIQSIGDKAFQSIKQYHPEKILKIKIDLLRHAKEQKSRSPISLFPFVHQAIVPLKLPVEDKMLSVVIPYYNMGKYIDECIKSVMATDYPQKEIIILNDGSTDPDSIEKLNRFENREDIKVIHQSNQGLAVTRNIGASLARGRFLAFLDADDRVSSTYYSKAVAVLNKYSNVFFVGCWVKYFENSNSSWPTFNPQPPYLLVHNTVNSSSLVYERHAFLAKGLNDKLVDYGLEDYESVIHLLSAGYNGVVLPEIHFFYRVRTGSMIRNIRREKWLYSYKYITEKHTSYYSTFAATVMHLLNANGPGYTFDNPTLEQYGTYRNKYIRFALPYIKGMVKRSPLVKRMIIYSIDLLKLKK